MITSVSIRTDEMVFTAEILRLVHTWMESIHSLVFGVLFLSFFEKILEVLVLDVRAVHWYE